jgi:hypothetical protein
MRHKATHPLIARQRSQSGSECVTELKVAKKNAAWFRHRHLFLLSGISLQLGCSVALGDVARLSRVQRSSEGCSVAQKKREQHS